MASPDPDALSDPSSPPLPSEPSLELEEMEPVVPATRYEDAEPKPEAEGEGEPDHVESGSASKSVMESKGDEDESDDDKAFVDAAEHIEEEEDEEHVEIGIQLPEIVIEAEKKNDKQSEGQVQSEEGVGILASALSVATRGISWLTSSRSQEEDDQEGRGGMFHSKSGILNSSNVDSESIQPQTTRRLRSMTQASNRLSPSRTRNDSNERQMHRSVSRGAGLALGARAANVGGFLSSVAKSLFIPPRLEDIQASFEEGLVEVDDEKEKEKETKEGQEEEESKERKDEHEDEEEEEEEEEDAEQEVKMESRAWKELRATQWWDPTSGKILSAKERIVHAAMFIEDSLVGDPVIERSTWMRKIHRFRNSVWSVVIWLLVLVHIALAWFEPPATVVGVVHPIITLIELVIVMFEWMDIIMLYVSIGPSFFLNKWHVVTLFVNVVILSDVAWAFSLPLVMRYRYSRILRPVLLLSRSKLLRDSLEAMLSTMRTLAKIAFALVFVMISFALIGNVLFWPIYPDSASLSVDGSFKTIIDSLLTLFVLLTTANYPAVSVPPVEQIGPFSILFFVVYLLIAMYLFLSVYLGAVFGAFKQLRSKRVIEERVRERRALSASFQYLDFEGENQLNFDVVIELFRYILPGISDWEAELRFVACDVDEDGKLDVVEYFNLIDALLLQFEDRRKHGFKDEGVGWFHALFTHKNTKRFMLFITVLQILVHSTFGLWVGGEGPLFFVTLGFTTLYTVEMSVRVVTERGDFWREAWNNLEVAVVLASVVGHLLFLIVYFPSPSKYIASDDLVVTLLNVARVLPVLRIVPLSSTMKMMLHRLLRVLPSLTPVVLAIGTLIYAYSIIGMEILNGSELPYFRDITSAFLSLFQLLSLASWHYVMFAYINTGYGLWIALYFVLFVILAVFLFVNLATAVVMEAYLVGMDLEDSRKERIDIEWSESEAENRRLSCANILQPVDFDTVIQDTHRITIQKVNRPWERDVPDIDLLTLMTEEEAMQLSVLLRIPKLIDLRRAKDEILFQRSRSSLELLNMNNTHRSGSSSSNRGMLNHVIQQLLFVSDSQLDPVQIRRVEQLLRERGLLDATTSHAFDPDLFRATSMKLFGARKARADRAGKGVWLVRETRLRAATVVKATVSE